MTSAGTADWGFRQMPIWVKSLPALSGTVPEKRFPPSLVNDALDPVAW